MASRLHSLLAAAALLAGLALPHQAAATGSPSAGRSPAPLPPQVLGLIAVAEPVPLTCEDGRCTALVSSFCLQEDRPPPTAGQVYDPAGAGDVTLVVTRTDGRTDEFSAAGLLSYESEGDFTRTRIAMDAGRLASLDAASVAIRIAPMVSLLPRLDREVAEAVRERDADAALGAPRFVAERFFAPGTARADAAVTMTRMINLLPAGRPVASDPVAINSTKRELLWNRVRDTGGLRGLSPDGIDRARAALDRCGAFAEMGYKLTLRGCLEKSHDDTLREVNDELWDAQPGY